LEYVLPGTELVLRLLDAYFSPSKPEFDSSVIHVEFVVDGIVLRQDFL
jgi:hypothetical protein